MRSFTVVYGARGRNPSFLTEDPPLPGERGLSWVRDKLEAEEHAASFAARYPEMVVTVLRLAPLLGPGVDTFYTRVFDKRVVPCVIGYDPLVQLLHPDDAADAMLARARVARRRGVQRRAPGRACPSWRPAPPRRQGPRSRAASRGLRGARTSSGRPGWSRRRAPSSTTPASRASPTAERPARARREHGAARPSRLPRAPDSDGALVRAFTVSA